MTDPRTRPSSADLLESVLRTAHERLDVRDRGIKLAPPHASHPARGDDRRSAAPVVTRQRAHLRVVK